MKTSVAAPRAQAVKTQRHIVPTIPRWRINRRIFFIAAFVLVGASVAFNWPTSNKLTAKDFRKMDVSTLIVQLESDDVIARRQASWALVARGSAAEPAIKSLKKAQFDSDVAVRCNCGIALVKIGPPAVPTLIELLTGPELKVRREAAVLLEHIGPVAAPAITDLIAAIGDPDVALSSNARQTLVAIGSCAVPALTNATKNPSTKVRLNAVSALGEMGSAAIASFSALRDRLNDERDDVRMAASTAIVRVAQRDVANLISVLNHDYCVVRQHAAAALGRLGADAAPGVQRLIERLNDDDAIVRQHAAIALGQIKSQSQLSVPALVNRLRDDAGGVRQAAATAIGHFGREAQSATPKLFELLRESATPTREFIREALINIVQDSVGPTE